MNYSVVIVDDEPIAIELLCYYLKGNADFSVRATFTNPVEAITFLNQNKTDLLFLDINMAAMSGLELVKNLNTKPLVVFTTAHKEYLQEGFDHGVMDYLQKPIKQERFQQSLNRALNILMHAPAKPKDDKIFIKSLQKEYSISINDILFIKAIKDYCQVFFTDDRKEMVSGSLKTFLDKHDPDNRFIRIHKSYVIPAIRLNQIFAGGIIQVGTHRLPIGRKYKDAVMALFKNSGN